MVLVLKERYGRAVFKGGDKNTKRHQTIYHRTLKQKESTQAENKRTWWLANLHA